MSASVLALPTLKNTPLCGWRPTFAPLCGQKPTLSLLAPLAPTSVVPPLALAIDAAVNMGVQMSPEDPAFGFFGCVLRSRIAGYQGSFLI